MLALLKKDGRLTKDACGSGGGETGREGAAAGFGETEKRRLAMLSRNIWKIKRVRPILVEEDREKQMV